MGGARKIDWLAELPSIWRAARGQVALFCALVALRKTESGPPGNEWGVMSIPSADTFEEELDIAARSIRNHVERCRVRGVRVHDPVTGLFSDAFLEDFSAKWAPLGAANDPRDLNRNHARNLVRLYELVAAKVAAQMAELAI